MGRQRGSRRREREKRMEKEREVNSRAALHCLLYDTKEKQLQTVNYSMDQNIQ